MRRTFRIELWLRSQLKLLFGCCLGVLTVLSIPVTIHSDVFEQGEFLRTLYLALRWKPAPVQLSAHLSAKPRSSSKPSVASTGLVGKPPLYVFALDVSGSLTKKRVAPIEVGRYLTAIDGEAGTMHARYCMGLGPDERPVVRDGKKWRSTKIAEAELCRLLDSVPVPANVALWAFGTNAMRVVPGEAEYGGARFLAIERPENGQHAMREFFNWVRPAEEEQTKLGSPDGSLTDIEGLLSKIRQVYRNELESETQEVHIVIISDLVHDIGPLEGKGDEEELPSEWESRYRASRHLLADHVRAIAENGNMLHLVIMQGGAISYRNVLPMFSGHGLDWERLRETRIGDGSRVPAFDFLRSYREVSEPFVFHYTSAGVKPLQLQIHFDLKEYEGVDLRMGLAADDGERLPPLKLWLESPRRGYTTDKHYTGLVSLEGRGYSRVMLRGGEDGDRLSLEPSMVLDPREAQRFRLLVALGNGKHEVGVSSSERVTYSVPIEFHKDLPRLSAWLISGLVLSLLVVGFLVFMSVFLSAPGWIRRALNGSSRLSLGGYRREND